MAKPATPKLRVFATVWWGYSYAFRHIPLMFRAGWPFLLAIWISQTAPLFVIHLPLSTLSSIATGMLVFSFFKWPLGAHFAVAWHRSILFGERKPTLLRFGKPEFLYALASLLLALPNYAFYWLRPHIFGYEEAVLLGGISRYAILAIVFLATPFLPALAVDDRAMSLRHFFRQLRGNWLRLVCVDVISTAVAFPIFWVAWHGFFYIVDGILRKDVFSIGYQRFDEIGIGFFKALAVSFCSTSAAAFVTLYVVAAGLSMLSLIYAGIVRRTLASQVDYAAVDRLAARLAGS